MTPWDQAARAIECPDCGAAVGKPCQSLHPDRRQGLTFPTHHTSRSQAVHLPDTEETK